MNRVGRDALIPPRITYRGGKRVGRHPQMPPQTMHLGGYGAIRGEGELPEGQERPAWTVAPYVERNGKLSQKCGSLLHLGDFWLKTAHIPDIIRLS